MKNLKQKILVATSTFNMYSSEDLIEKLKENNFEVDVNGLGRKYLHSELCNIIHNYDGIIAGTETYDRVALNNAQKLKVISRLGVGTDNIDFPSIKAKNIKVFTTQTSPGLAVAELSLSLMLDLYRKISLQNNDLKNCVWEKKMGNLLSGKTLGIVGLGSVGKSLIRITKGFNFRILAYDLIKDIPYAQKHNIVYCDLKKLMMKSDVVSVHLSLSETTKNLMNQDILRLAKPKSIIINTSRGGILDEDVLFELLKNNHIKGAGIDVFLDEPYSGPLTKLKNTILTPHIGSYAKEIRVKLEEESINNLINGLFEKNN